jgi:hypothetical protein
VGEAVELDLQPGVVERGLGDARRLDVEPVAIAAAKREPREPAPVVAGALASPNVVPLRRPEG